jgi:hypothetical protein
MSSFACAGVDEADGESFDVTTDDSRDEGAPVACRAELLKTEEAELVCELVDSTVLGMSAGGDSFGSGR